MNQGDFIMTKFDEIAAKLPEGVKIKPLYQGDDTECKITFCNENPWEWEVNLQKAEEYIKVGAPLPIHNGKDKLKIKVFYLKVKACHPCYVETEECSGWEDAEIDPHISFDFDEKEFQLHYQLEKVLRNFTRVTPESGWRSESDFCC